MDQSLKAQRLGAMAIALLFIAMAGWGLPESWQEVADFSDPPHAGIDLEMNGDVFAGLCGEAPECLDYLAGADNRLAIVCNECLGVLRQ
jgi:hypothetical protein